MVYLNCLCELRHSVPVEMTYSLRAAHICDCSFFLHTHLLKCPLIPQIPSCCCVGSEWRWLSGASYFITHFLVPASHCFSGEEEKTQLYHFLFNLYITWNVPLWLRIPGGDLGEQANSTLRGPMGPSLTVRYKCLPLC